MPEGIGYGPNILRPGQDDQAAAFLDERGGPPPEPPPPALARVPMGGGPDPVELEQLRRLDAELADVGVPQPPPSPVDHLFGQADTLAAEADQLRAMADARSRVSAPNPLYGPTREYTDTMGGLMTEADTIAQQVADARVNEARVQANTFDQKAREYRNIAIDHKAAEQVRQEQIQQQRQAQQQAVTAHDDAIAKVRDAQAIDPDRWWADKSTGGKIATAVGIMLAGIGGGAQGNTRAGFDLVQSLMGNEVEKQREEYHRLQNIVDQRERQVAEQGSLYAQTMAQVQDERQADIVIENAQIEAALAEAEAMLAHAGVGTMTAEQAAAVNDMRQKLAANRLKLEQLAATNTPRRVVSGYAFSPQQRAAMQREADRIEKRADRTADLGMKRAEYEYIKKPETDYRFGLDLEKQHDAQRATARKDHKKRVAEYEADMTTAQGLLALPNLRGVGIGGSIGELADPREAARVRRELKSLDIDPDEHWTEQEIRGQLEAVINLRQGQQRAFARGMSPAEFEEYYGRPKPPDAASLEAFLDDQVAPSPVRED